MLVDKTVTIEYKIDLIRLRGKEEFKIKSNFLDDIEDATPHARQHHGEKQSQGGGFMDTLASWGWIRGQKKEEKKKHKHDGSSGSSDSDSDSDSSANEKRSKRKKKREKALRKEMAQQVGNYILTMKTPLPYYGAPIYAPPPSSGKKQED